MDYKGLKWYKCDLHLHTPASKCFLNKSITPSEYLEKVKEKNLNVIAITDHNTAGWIDKLKLEAATQDITIFPGVELTVGEKRIHLLILFDTDSSDRDIEDFLLYLGLTREQFSKDDTFVNQTVDFVLNECRKKRLLVIPSHVDNFSGLCELSNGGYSGIIKSGLFDGVHITQKASNSDITPTNDMFSSSEFHEKKDLVNICKEINEKNICKLTFSDNPDSTNSKKHGIDGIGEFYTWIKMKDAPNLDSLKQALNMKKDRTKNFFVSPNFPYSLPKFWIENLSFKNTKINTNEISIFFTPQMTSIIGGRGTGKSSVLSIIRGLLSIHSRIDKISKSLSSFFSTKKEGILKLETEIFLICNLENEKYKILLLNNPEEILLYKLNKNTKTFDEITEKEAVLSRIREEIEIYSQKEIFEIAEDTNSLLEIIDSDIIGINKKTEDIEKLQNSFKESFFKQNELQILKTEFNKLQKEISLDTNIISGLEKNNYRELLEKEINDNEAFNFLLSIKTSLDEKIKTLNSLKSSVVPSTDLIMNEELENIIDSLKQSLDLEKIDNLITSFELQKTKFWENINSSSWFKEKIETTKKIEEIRATVNGDDSKIESILKRLTSNKERFNLIKEILRDDETIKNEMDHCINNIENLRSEISSIRENYLSSTITNQKISMKIIPYRDLVSFEIKLRKILRKDNEFIDDINNLLNFLSHGKILDNKKKLMTIIEKIKRGDDIEEISLTSRFKTLISSLKISELADLYLLYPDDKLEIKYESQVIKNLSAGQKTSIILNYLLARGNKALILDQPEDDLDNKLIYDLVVKEAIRNKENRQIVVVTHNANIPVNGDTEWTVVMDSDGKEIKLEGQNTIDHSDIIINICDIMEGGISAFKSRGNKYNVNI